MKKLRFNRKQLLRAIYLAAVAIALSFTTSAQAQTVVPTSVFAPYSADLTNGGSFTTTDTGPVGIRNPGDSATWTPTASGFQGTVNDINNSSNPFYVTATAGSTIVSNLGPATSANNFVVTSDFSATSFSGYKSGSVSIFALGNGGSASAYDFNRTGYTAGMAVGSPGLGTPGTISIGGTNTSGAFGLATGATPLIFTAGDIYHLVLQGTYDVSNQLTMTLTVTDLNDLSNTESISTTPIASPFTGQNFGSEIGVVDSSVTATVSNFSVDFATVPEPSNYAMMILGGALLLGLGLRRKTTLD